MALKVTENGLKLLIAYFFISLKLFFVQIKWEWVPYFLSKDLQWRVKDSPRVQRRTMNKSFSAVDVV